MANFHRLLCPDHRQYLRMRRHLLVIARFQAGWSSSKRRLRIPPEPDPLEKLVLPVQVRHCLIPSGKLASLAVLLLVGSNQTSHRDCDVEHTSNCFDGCNHPRRPGNGKYIAVSHRGQGSQAQVKKGMARSRGGGGPTSTNDPG